MGSSNDDSNDWLVVDSDGALGSVSEEEAMLRIFGPLDAEPDLEDLLDAEIEVKDSAGAPPKRTTQRTLDDLFRGKPKAKPSSSRQTAGSHRSGNAHRSQEKGAPQRRITNKLYLIVVTGSMLGFWTHGVFACWLP